MTGKERQIWFWEREKEARFNAWKELQKIGDTEGARQAKEQYIIAVQCLDEVSRRGEI